jgi:hypothetical protein
MGFIILEPEDCIKAYAYRFKIEPSFCEQKHDMGCFSYRFWSKLMPKRKRWKKADKQPITPEHKNIDLAKKATDAFVCVATIATGILTLVAFLHSSEVWKQYPGWLRTRRSTTPTIAIVREVIAESFFEVLEHSTWFTGFNFMWNMKRKKSFLYEEPEQRENIAA